MPPAMRVVVVTNEKPHHLYFAATIAGAHNVVGVVHPEAKPDTRRQVLGKLRRRYRSYGAMLTALHVLSRFPPPVAGWRPRVDEGVVEAREFATSKDLYETNVPFADRHRVADLNGPEGIALIRGLEPDVVVCLGGPIFRQDLISACRFMINYHTGLSPIYNGFDTISLAFADGHPHLCAGTLMKTNPVVDGGEILGHFLPSITEDDTPATLFAKAVKGAAVLANEFLAHLDRAGSYVSVPQPPPHVYAVSARWNLNHGHMVNWHLRRRTCQQHLREEAIVRYWDASTVDAAKSNMQSTLTGLLLRNGAR